MIHGFTKPVLFKLHRLLSIDLRGKKYVKTTVKWPTCHNNNLLHAIEMLSLQLQNNEQSIHEKYSKQISQEKGKNWKWRESMKHTNVY